jgi:fatty-acyl-CoA synthase
MLSSSPASVPVCAHHPGDEVSLAERIEQVARTDAGLIFLDEQLRPEHLPYRDLAVRATEVARRLEAEGVAAGDRICLLSPTTPAMLTVLFGAWRLGAAPVVLPRPRRTSASSQLEELGRRVEAAGAALLLTGGTPAAQSVPAGVRALDVAEVAAGGGTGRTPPVPGPDVLGLLQFTSGTTAVSRAVPVSQGQMVGNIARLAARLGVGPGDRCVTWLPLYHDMGLLTLGGLAAAGLDLVVMATETFTGDPSAWMRTVHEYRGTLTFAPNFAYALAAQMLRRGRSRVDLGSLRAAVNGAEAIDVDALERSLDVLTGHGMRAEAMCPGYGLAEATLAVTSAAPGTAVRTVRPTPAPGSRPVPDRRLTSCGAQLPDTQLSIRDEAGAELPPGHVGEILVRGPGVMAGYWDATSPSGDGGLAADGWLPTGDLGFLDEGELVVCGRLKDLIIVGGRNFYPEDYEIVAEQVPGIRPGNVAAFSLPDAERMVVIAEARGTAAAALDGIAGELFSTLRSSLDCAPHEVVLIRPGTLPKTSSGKRRRGEARQLYLDGTLQVTHRLG